MLWLIFLLLQTNDAQPKQAGNAAAPVQVSSTAAPAKASSNALDALSRQLTANVLQARKASLSAKSAAKTANKAQQRQHAANAAAVMGHYGPELTRLDDLTPEAALTITPEPEPTRTYQVRCPKGSGTVRVWEGLADMELAINGPIGGDVFWELTAKAATGPTKPENWSTMSWPDRYQWQHDHNFVTIGLRTQAPDETEPFSLRLRPRDYYTYFETQHNWCDPFHQNAAGDCRAVNTFIADPLQLRAQKGTDAVVWQIDYRIGEVGELQDGWKRREESTLFARYDTPQFQAGAAQLRIAPLPEVVDVTLVCDE